jgi:ferredoxin
MTTRLHVDWTRCDGHGSCTELLPELLVQDEWGFPLSRTGDTDPAVPRQLDDLARRAISACPLQALRLQVTAR